MFINCLFFNDTTMHKIYQDKGNFNLIYFLPQIVYSIIICSIFNIIIKKVYLSQKSILDIKYDHSINNINSRVVTIIKCLMIKFIFFFAFNLIFLIFFWYFLSCFSIVFFNTQIYLFKIILISFSLSLIWPLFIYLLVSLFRISAINGPGKFLYKLSQIIQFF